MGLKRPDAVRLGIFAVLALIVIIAAVLFHVRVRIAGLKYLIVILGVVAVAWWIGRRRP